jgi:uncharacterized phage-associated protein
MQFRYDELKATQAAAYLINKYGGRLNYMKLIKMIYIANRESLALYGQPIVPDSFVSMPHGPVLSSLYDQISNPSEDLSSYWDQHIEMVERYTLGLKGDPGVFKLNRRSLKLLDKVDSEWHEKSQYAIRDWTHDRKNIPEWKDPQGSSCAIQVEEILARVGWDPKKIDEYIEEESQYAKEQELMSGIADFKGDDLPCKRAC